MTTADDDFLRTLRATFMVEAKEHVQAMTTGLLELEKSPAPERQRMLIDSVFRAAHSLKGAARAVDLTDIESHCQALEDRFATWRRQGSAPQPSAFDSVHRTLDAIRAAMNVAVPPTMSAPAPVTPPRDIAPPDAGVPATAITADKGRAPEESVRISVVKLERRLIEAEEMLTAKLATGQRVEDLRELVSRFDWWKKEWTSVEPEARALRQMIERTPADGDRDPAALRVVRVLDFLDWTVDSLTALENSVVALTRTADHDRQVVARLVDDLLEDSKKLLLLPFGTLAAAFPRLVRDLCRDQGKEADVVVRGEDIEIDKRIMEEMKDPLVHLLRNAVDHGVETPEERRRSGKPPRATITLAASQVNGNKVELLVSDDGAGIDAGRVKQSAVEQGVLSADAARELGEVEACRLIFQADVSTSPIITRLSGRGLGLAIVREKTERLGGTVSVKSEARRGTRFSIALPSTLATFRGILIETAQHLFVVPTFHVERVTRVKADDISTVEGRDTVSLSGRAVSLVWLADVLELPPVPPPESRAAVVVLVLGTADQRVAFAIDAAHDEQEVLVKPLRKPLSRVRNIAGVTVLGSGQVVPILNVSDLLISARKAGRTAARAEAERPSEPGTIKSVLVAEDSITSRMLIKGILESAGYRVETAVDGMEAFTLLRAKDFDLVVSDVEMPRLNGFDLTARIRADKRLADLPVILVTALETPEDRERGIDTGANAYIVKSRFDQSDLVDAIRRLL